MAPGAIRCEYVRNKYQCKVFNIGYFNPNSLSTTITANKVKKAILTKLELLNKKGQRYDARIINKNTGLEYQSDHDYIKSDTTIVVKLKPTTLQRIKYYKNKVDINNVILNINKRKTKNNKKKANPKPKSINSIKVESDKKSKLKSMEQEIIKRYHHGLSKELLPIDVIEKEIKQRISTTTTTVDDKNDTLSPNSPCSSPDIIIDEPDDDDTDCIEEMEEIKDKINDMMDTQVMRNYKGYEEEWADDYWNDYGEDYKWYLYDDWYWLNVWKEELFKFNESMIEKYHPSVWTEYQSDPSDINDKEIGEDDTVTLLGGETTQKHPCVPPSQINNNGKNKVTPSEKYSSSGSELGASCKSKQSETSARRKKRKRATRDSGNSYDHVTLCNMQNHQNDGNVARHNDASEPLRKRRKVESISNTIKITATFGPN